jgi:flagellar motor switch protein FliN
MVEKKIQSEKPQKEMNGAKTAEMDQLFGTEVAPAGDSLQGDIARDFSLEFLFDLELQVSVELARKDMAIQDILQLGEGSIIEFDKMPDENVDIYVNNRKIAKGEVVVIDDRFGVRITGLVNPSDRLKGITR